MPRDGSGVYTLPAVYDVTSGDTILPAQVETPFEDLESDMNAARPVVAGGTGGATASAARTNLGLDFQGVRATKSAVQSIATATITSITFDQEDHDASGMHSTSTNTQNFTIPSGWSKALIVANVEFETSLSSFNVIGFIRKNGVSVARQYGVTDAALAEFSVNLSAEVAVSPGDVIVVAAYQSSGSAENVNETLTSVSISRRSA